MKKVFCAYQNERPSFEQQRMIYECVIYGKECPYAKLSKAEKKCQEVSPITKKE